MASFTDFSFDDQPDKLSQLLETRLDEIPFPSLSFTESGSHDLAQHKYPNVDGARIEDTGLNPNTYSIKAIFTNNIYPGINETWQQGTLFPDTFYKILNLVKDSSSSKIFNHPAFGAKEVIVLSWQYQFTGGVIRDGAILDFVVMETISDSNINDTISAPSTIASNETIGNSLDTEFSKTTLQPINPPNLTLGQFFSKINGLVKSATLIPRNSVAPIKQQIIQIGSNSKSISNTLSSSTSSLLSIGRSSVQKQPPLNNNSIVFNSAANFPIINIPIDVLDNVYSTANALNNNTNNSVQDLIQSSTAFIQALIYYYQTISRNETANMVSLLYTFLSNLQKTLALISNKKKPVLIYNINVPTTLIQLSKIVNNSIDQLISLNPKLIGILLNVGTQVNYYDQ